MASALAPSGFGSCWLRRANSTSGSAFKPGVGDWARAVAATARYSNDDKVGNRTTPIRASRVREIGSNPRASPAAVPGVFHRPAFRFDLRQPGAALHFHDLVAQKRRPLEFQ